MSPDIPSPGPDANARADADTLRAQLHDEADRTGGDHVAIERLMEFREQAVGLVSPSVDNLPQDRRLAALLFGAELEHFRFAFADFRSEPVKFRAAFDIGLHRPDAFLYGRGSFVCVVLGSPPSQPPPLPPPAPVMPLVNLN